MLSLRHMHAIDIPQVMSVERLCFPDPWPARSYYFEVNESNVSHMVVLERGDILTPPTAHPLGSLQRFLRQLRGEEPPAPSGEIVGFGGLWCIADEAHVSTIASHPDERGKGYGEALLSGMIQRALRLGAAYVVLEVRVSNSTAQALYHKYGFVTQARNPRYYADGEDAFLMRLDFTATARAHLDDLHAHICERVGFHDAYVHAPHPRMGL